MPRIPSLTPKELVRKFKKIGYIEDRQKGSHIILYYPRPKRRIVVPIHIRDLPRGTLHAIIKQAGLTREEFMKL